MTCLHLRCQRIARGLAKAEETSSTLARCLHFSACSSEVERCAWDAEVEVAESSGQTITFFRGVVGSTQEFDSCRLGPSPGGRNKA